MLDKLALRTTKPIVDRLAREVSARGFTADQVSFAALGLGLFASLIVITGFTKVALFFLFAGRVADGIDGAVARMTAMQSDCGAFLDIALDFVFYASVPLAFVLHDPAANGVAGAVLLASFVTTGTSFLAYASIAAKRGEKSTDYPMKGIYYLGGITEGTETIGFFALCCLFPSWFPVLAYIYALLCAFTSFTRIKAGWDQFR